MNPLNQDFIAAEIAYRQDRIQASYQHGHTSLLPGGPWLGLRAALRRHSRNYRRHPGPSRGVTCRL